jgi:NADH:ubiquinone oxidoreductase subunit
MSHLGTRLMSWWKGELVGTDQFGNRYYRVQSSDRRWVLYQGLVEASKVPPEWHAWLHRISDAVPESAPKRRFWQREHLPNLTGTRLAYRPAGDLDRGGKHAPAASDYEAWRPNG